MAAIWSNEAYMIFGMYITLFVSKLGKDWPTGLICSATYLSSLSQWSII